MKLQITIEGRAYAVDVELLEEDEAASAEEAPLAPFPAVPFGSPAAGADPNVCLSPVTGLVIRVNVESGQLIQAGELIAVLEAMKMETNIHAPRRATVKSVRVKPGDPVKLGQVLVEFADAGAEVAGESSE